ncbi:MAG TPA: 3-dehydroquinate synthase [Chloroflexota bacterium]|jgi:3-dehydroquinate synthase|nr:3-dehydroquinate synthase [Chloroflexota bacterium]
MTTGIATRWLRAGGRDVPLLAGPSALAELPRALAEAGFEGRLFVVADTRALELHGSQLSGALAVAPRLAISGDEADKTLAQVSRIWDWLVEQGVQRRDALVAFGGGVVCDLAGFAAASYLRGIGLVNAPTTLLAQVDAAVGGKTGVNHPRGKNLIGAFYQPLCVVADTSLLATLPQRAFAAGMAEVAKMAMILDSDLFSQLEAMAPTLEASDAAALAPVVARSIEIKAEIVERDERESGDRMLLNYGHTVGHALEAGNGYGTLLHGEAVAVGMQAAAHIAQRLDLLSPADAHRQTALLTALGLPLTWPTPLDDVLSRLTLDKKRAGSRQRWVLAERVGFGRIHSDVPPQTAVEAIQAVTLA